MPCLSFTDIIFVYLFIYLYGHFQSVKNPFEPGFQSEPFTYISFLEKLSKRPK